MKRIALALLIVMAAAFVAGCSKDEPPQTAEEAQKVAATKIEEVQQYLEDKDYDQAQDVVATLEEMAQDAPEEAKEPLQEAVKTAKAAIEAAKAGESGEGIINTITGGD
jgi:Tfp pilus assembly protein PilF